MPLLVPPPGPPLARREKRKVAALAAILLVLLAGVGIWAGTRSGSYGESRAGCVTVTIPSTTGGALVHECGAAARTFCHDAFTHNDRLSLLARPECRKAGLGA